MSCLSKLIFVMLLFCLPTLSWAEDYDQHIYSQPIKYASKYQDQIQNIIITSMANRHWSVKSQEPGKITAWLENYKGYQLVIDISYGDSKIDFSYVDFKKLDCPKCNKSKYKKYYLVWRLNLRSTINKALHKQSMLALLENPKTLNLWLKTIRNGSQIEKLKIGRYIFELALFEPKALNTIAEEVETHYLKELSRQDIQVFAFYCKSLASTKDEKFKDLLTRVRDNAEESKLSSYVEGYLAAYFENG